MTVTYCSVCNRAGETKDLWVFGFFFESTKPKNHTVLSPGYVSQKPVGSEVVKNRALSWESSLENIPQ